MVHSFVVTQALSSTRRASPGSTRHRGLAAGSPADPASQGLQAAHDQRHLLPEPRCAWPAWSCPSHP